MLKLLFVICILLPTLSKIDTVDLCLTEFVKTNTAGTTLCLKEKRNLETHKLVSFY